MFIETPKDPKLKAATRSDYKHHQTLKVLVSIMPCGAFNFISEAWGGRASDVAVTQESGFYDLLEYGDLLLDSNCARILVSGFLAVNYGAVQILHFWRSCLRLFFNVLK
jgi:hypothetical protein